MSIDQFLLSADTTDLDYPEVRPTLDLNFARVKALDPRITFTRASGGSYVGADGLIKYAGVNEARFDHDPETGESLGLLIEEARTNLFTQSEDFSTVWVTPGASVTTNIIAAPDGSFTADKLTEDTTPSRTHLLFQGFPYTSGVTYTVTFFVKAAGRNQFRIRAATQATFPGTANFNLSTGTATSLNGTSSIVPIENGWYRCSVTAAATANGTTGTGIYLIDGGLISYNGDGVSGIYIWGAQLEEGSFPTSYIPTQASTRTRARDSASITGKNFSSFYRQDEGTVFVDFRLNTDGTARVFNIDDGTGNNRISGLGGSTFYQTFFLPGNRGPSITLPSSVRYKVMSAHKDYDVTNYLNENYFNSTTGRDIIIPKNLNTFRIGNWQNNTLQGTTIARLTYYPKRLPNAQLQALTR
jgi:hypothetical protein